MAKEMENLNKTLSNIPWEDVDTLEVTWEHFKELQGEVQYSKFLPNIKMRMKDEVLP